MQTMRKLSRSQSGQGMTEYIIIVALVAISCIASVSLFGDSLRKIFGTSVNALADKSTADTENQVRYKVHGRRTIQNFAKCVDNPYSCS